MKKFIVFFGMLTMAVSLSVAGSKDDPTSSNIAIVKSGAAIKVFYTSDESRFAKVSIIDNKGKIVFYDIVRSRKGFIRSYDISKLDYGQYVVRVSDSNGNQSQSFSIENDQEVMYRVTQVDDNKFIVSVPASESNAVAVKIYDQERKLLYSGVEKLQGDFAKVYTIKGLTGPPTFVVNEN